MGNEAVDQLVKFNAALADHSSQNNPHLIDGIVLTKFDTIDDKVSLDNDHFSWYYLYNLSFLIPTGWLCYLHDVHNGTTDCLCRNWTNLH